VKKNIYNINKNMPEIIMINIVIVWHGTSSSRKQISVRWT